MYTDGMLVDPTVGVMRDNLMRTCKDHHNCDLNVNNST